MSKVTRVIVLCPKGRRQTVNLTPNNSILQVLEEVCQKQNLNPDDFDVCHYNKPLDLSLPVRFANLANNAQLELQPAKIARKDCLVTVGLQLESGERIMKDFVPSTSIWDVVDECLKNKSDAVNTEKNKEPVCVYMRQQLSGDALKETTLRGLGLTKGSAILRLMYRNPEDLSDQAHISTPLTKPQKDLSPEVSADKYLKNSSEMECDVPLPKPLLESHIRNSPAVDPVPVIPAAPAPTENFSSVAKNNENLKNSDLKMKEENIGKGKLVKNVNISIFNEIVSQMETDQTMESDSADMGEFVGEEEEIGAMHYIGGRHAILYSLNDITETKKADLPDEFFQLTIEDARYLMEEFKKTRVALDNQPLLTKELRNRQMLQTLGRFKQTVIRVNFPERLVLQAVFEAQETIKDVCDFIRSYLEDKNLNFYLYTAPPKEKKDPAKTLIESMLIPAAVVYFGCEKQHEYYLMESLKDKISDPRAASLAAYESRKDAIREIEEISNESIEMPMPSTSILTEPPTDDYKVPGPSFSQPSNSIQTSEKVPKWLKMSKK